MIPNILANLKTDPSLTIETAASELADIFSSVKAMASNVNFMREIYLYLREQPELSRALFDALVKRHNDATANPPPGDIIPGCCCCGIDPYEPEKQLEKDLAPLEAAALATAQAFGPSSANLLAFLTSVADYRRSAHARTESPVTILANKKSVGAVIFNRFTSPTPINATEAEYLYSVLERNECIGEDLYEYALAGSRLAGLLSHSYVSDSPVVSAVRAMFGNVVVAGREGGGCCCCCCCCCCGGGC